MQNFVIFKRVLSVKSYINIFFYGLTLEWYIIELDKIKYDSMHNDLGLGT